MIALPETAQEVFDIVASHLLLQNKRSEEQGFCVYRSQSGLKCAAGCLIPDEAYDPQMEGMPWSTLICRGIVSDKHADLIMALQFVHDTSSPNFWPYRLKKVADRYNLSAAIIALERNP